MEATGEHGVITIEDSSTSETTVAIADGMQFDRGYISKYFVTDTEKGICEYENPLIFLSDEKIVNIHEFKSVFNYAIVKEKKPIIIIASDYDDDIVSQMAINRVKNGIPIVAIKAPGFGDRKVASIEDIAIYIGCKVFNKEKGDRYDRITPEYFGTCNKINITASTTTISGHSGDMDRLKERVIEISNQIDQTDKDFDREKLRERLARLAGGIAVIRVGALTESELMEKKDRVEDALNATKAATEEGIVPGGGVALLRCIPELLKVKADGDEGLGVKLLAQVIEEPIKQILSNAGENYTRIIKKIKKGNYDFGYNVRTESYENLCTTGVIDPTKVVKAALKNAVAVAALMLTTEAIITGIPQEFNVKE